MSLTDSPQSADYRSDRKSGGPGFRFTPTRIAIAVLLVAAVVIGGMLLMQRLGSVQTATGSVAGQVVDAAGAPQANVYVYVEGGQNSAVTGPDGRFLLVAAPAGSHQLVIGVTPEPIQFQPVEVPRNSTAELGQIVFPSP